MGIDAEQKKRNRVSEGRLRDGLEVPTAASRNVMREGLVLAPFGLMFDVGR